MLVGPYAWNSIRINDRSGDRADPCLSEKAFSKEAGVVSTPCSFCLAIATSRPGVVLPDLFVDIANQATERREYLVYDRFDILGLVLEPRVNDGAEGE
jgi:hypothetical protein